MDVDAAFYRRHVTIARRLALGVALLLTLIGAAACRRTPVEIPDPPAPVPTRLDGTLVFLGGGGERAGEIWGLSGTNPLRLRRDVDYQTVAVSPDGSRYAWIADGRLTVAEESDPARAVGPSGLDPAFVPQWSPDGGSLIVRTGGTSFGRVDLSSGELAGLGDQPYAAFSVDGGKTAIYGDPARGEWTVAGADGATAPVVPPPFRQYSRFQSLAPDGRHVVALLRGFTEPVPGDGRRIEANAIVDILTGSVLPVPGGGTVRQGFFRADGGAVLRVSEGIADRVLLVSPDGSVSDRVDLPASVSDLALLTYLPEPAAGPTPSASPSPSPAPSPSPTAAHLAGTLFLLGDSGGLHTLAGGVLTPVPDEDDPDFLRTVAVSPAGSRYAWIDGSRLRVAGLTGSGATVGPSTLDGSFVPVWVESSLLVRYGAGNYGLIDSATGTLTALPDPATPYLAVSPDGAFAVTATADRAIVHVSGEPSPVPVVAPAGKKIVSYASLSPDGHHALVQLADADDPTATRPAFRSLGASAVVDLSNGEVWAIPAGGTLQQGFFQPDGSVVLRVDDEVVLLSRTGDLLDRYDLPASAAALSLLAYAA